MPGVGPHQAAGAPRLSVTDQLARPTAKVAGQQAALAQRTNELRLAETRTAITQWKAAQKQAAGLAAKTAAAVLAASGSPRQVAEAMLGSFGWSSSQFSCLDPLWHTKAAGA